MIQENREMNQRAPLPQSIGIVVIATLGSLALAYLLWGIVSFSALSIHDALGDAALPMLTDKLIRSRMLFWSLPVLSFAAGAAILATHKNSAVHCTGNPMDAIDWEQDWFIATSSTHDVHYGWLSQSCFSGTGPAW
jgi:hypothetical protein